MSSRDFKYYYYGACELVKIEKDTYALNRAKIIANDVFSEIINLRDWSFLWTDWSFQTEANKYQYAMPSHCDKIMSMWSTSRNQPVTVADANMMDRFDPNPENTGDVYNYMVRGIGMKNQPHSVITFESDSVDEDCNVKIYGWSYGRRVSETVALSGTTAVSTTKKFSYIHKITPPTGGTTGTVAVTSNSGNVSTATMTAGSSADIISVTHPKTKITFNSTSTSDAGKELTIVGIDSDTDLQKKESLVMGGAGSVVSSNYFNRIMDITKNSTTGTVTAVDDQGTQLWAAGPQDKAMQFLIVDLWNPPSGTDTIIVRFKRKIMPLNNDYDPVPFPQEYAPYIRHLIMSRIYDYIGHNLDKSRAEEAKWREGLAIMKRDDNAQRAAWVIAGRNEVPSQLKRAMFPYGGYSISG